MEAGVGRHEPSRRDENFRGERTRPRRHGVIEMVQQSMGMDKVERAERIGIGVEHVGDEERAALTETRSRVLDVLSAHVKPDVFDADVREVVDEIAGTTADVEKAIAATRPKMAVDDRTLEVPSANGPLVDPKDRGEREH